MKPSATISKRLPWVIAVGLSALAAATVLLTLNRLGVLRLVPLPLDAVLARTAATVFPPPPNPKGKPFVAGHPLVQPDQGRRIPEAAVALMALQEDADRKLTRYALAVDLKLLKPAEQTELLHDIRRDVSAARDILRQLLRVDPAAAARLVSALGWPWTPVALDQWAPDRAWLAFSDRPVCIRDMPLDKLRPVRVRLEATDNWRAAAEALKGEGWTQEQVDGVLVWSTRLALKSGFDSDRDLRRARRTVARYFALAPFQTDWVMGLWAAQRLTRQGRFALPHLVRLYRTHPEALLLVRAVARRMDMDEQVKAGMHELRTGSDASRDRAEQMLIALGPFALATVAASEERADAAARKRFDRVISAIRAEWPEEDTAGDAPADRWACWDRWLRRARPWLY